MKRARILLVESELSERLRLLALLEAQGLEVVRATSAEEAMQKIENMEAAMLPRLAVVSASLRGMSAGQLVRRLRMDSRMRGRPILMLTGDVSPELEREGLESGADAYISRSAHPDLLHLRMRALFQSGAEWVPGETAGGLRRPRIVIARPPSDAALLAFWNDPAAAMAALEGAPIDEEEPDIEESGPGLGELLWRDGHTVTSVERSHDLVEGAWLVGAAAPDCLVIADMGQEGDLEFCRLLETRRQAIKEAGGVPFRVLGVVEAERFRSQSCGVFFETGIDDLVPSDIARDVLALRIRTQAHRRMAEETLRHREAERQQDALALEAARARAEVADALEHANQELAQINAQLLQAQAKLVHAAKMASLGELVAGIAHEINNPLAYTLGHASTVGRSLDVLRGELENEQRAGSERPLSPKAAQALVKGEARLQSMKTGLQRIQNLVLRLRRFSRLDEGSFQKVDVSDALETALALLAHKLGNGLSVERRLDAPNVLVCQTALINQAVMNLVSNAADALAPDETGKRGGQKIIVSTGLEAGRYVISVADDGPGLPEELRARVFDPFFTTKPVGEGTGLGLAIVHSVVDAHGGTIDIGLGLEGRGVRFRVSVPVAETPQGLAAAPQGRLWTLAADILSNEAFFNEPAKESRPKELMIAEAQPVEAQPAETKRLDSAENDSNA